MLNNNIKKILLVSFVHHIELQNFLNAPRTYPYVLNSSKLQKSQFGSPFERSADEIQPAFNRCTVGEVGNVAGMHTSVITRLIGLPRRSSTYQIVNKQYNTICQKLTDIQLNSSNNNKKLSCCYDSRSYCERRMVYLQSVVWNSHGHYEYLLSYSFKLTFDCCVSCQNFRRALIDIRCVFWLNDTSYSKSV